MPGVFICGTDTGCGKTTTAAALAHGLRLRGLRVGVLKPIETGCEPDPETREPRPLDALTLARAAADPRTVDRICPYALPLPAAPVVAAVAAGVVLDVERLDASYRDSTTGVDLTLVEGAGGLCVPLTSKLDMLDLAMRWELPLLLVARARLGTINHTLLSLAEARRRGARVLGVVISHTEPELSSADRENLSWLLARCPVPVLGELEHVASAEASSQNLGNLQVAMDVLAKLRSQADGS